MKIELPEKLSLTFYLMATGKKKRVKTTVWIEEIYKELLKEEQKTLSDLINYLLELYLRETGKLDVKEYLEKLKS